MTKYEYNVVNRDQAENLGWISDMMNEMGEAGWRLIQVVDRFFLFERPVDAGTNVVINMSDPNFEDKLQGFLSTVQQPDD